MFHDIPRPWHHAETPFPHATVPLTSFLDEAARLYPKRCAFCFQNAKITYAQLQERAERFAGALQQHGFRSGEKLAIMLPNLPQSIIAFWGALKAWATIVMINPLYMEKELLDILNDSQATTLVTLDLLWPRLAALQQRLPIRRYIITGIEDGLAFPLKWLYRWKQRRQKQHPHIPDQKHISSWSQFLKQAPRFCAPLGDPCTTPALVQYTGGTTGIPKGVMLTHSNLATNAQQILATVDVTAATPHRFIALLPFFHVYGLAVGITIPAALAATTYPMPRYVPQDVLSLIAKQKLTVFPGAPAIYTSLLQQKSLKNYDLTSLELCISGSAPLPIEIYKQFHEVTGATIIEGYGLTEASPITHINPHRPGQQKEASIGLPLPGTDACIVDAEDGTRLMPIGEAGELIIKGPQVMQGYWQRPEDTQHTLREGWLYTGDIAVMDSDGYFYIKDRKKDLVLIGGYNVYPREIEEVLYEHPHVAEAACVGISDPLRGEIIKAYIVPKAGTTLDRATVVSWCRSKLASYKVPRAIEFREELPKTLVGKVLRRHLRQEEEEKNTQNKDNNHASAHSAR